MSPMQYLAEKAMVAESNICKWAKDERRIVQQASSQIVANLTKTPHPKQWFPSAEQKLYSLFLARRKNKQKVVNEVDNGYLQEDSARGPRGRQAFMGFPGILQVGSKVGEKAQFVHQEEKQQQEQVRARAPALNTEVAQKRFRQLLREPRHESGKVVEGSAWIEPAPASTGEWAEEAKSEPASSRTGESAEEPESHTKWGRFLLNQRWSAGQVPLGFVSGQDSTWEERGSKRVHIAQPFPGLEKCQCTVQPTINSR